MNRVVQKLIAGAAAVAIAVTGLLGGAPVAKAADPTTGTITISNASGDTATHTLDGWKLASLKNVASADGKLTFLIDTNNAMVPLIEASMTSDQLALYKADANYYTENGKETTRSAGLLPTASGAKLPRRPIRGVEIRQRCARSRRIFRRSSP